jgi:hypothetical protein
MNDKNVFFGSISLKKTSADDLKCLFGKKKKTLIVERVIEGAGNGETRMRPTSLRQMPENYCIARFDQGQRCWVIDPDLAANTNLVFFVFELLLLFHLIKWDSTGVFLENTIKDAMDSAGRR